MYPKMSSYLDDKVVAALLSYQDTLLHLDS